MKLLRRVASQSALCYEFATVLSWFAARPIRVAEDGFWEAIDLDRYRNRTKNFRAIFPLKSTP